jgi:hypothetical protein
LTLAAAAAAAADQWRDAWTGFFKIIHNIHQLDSNTVSCVTTPPKKSFRQCGAHVIAIKRKERCNYYCALALCCRRANDVFSCSLLLITVRRLSIDRLTYWRNKFAIRATVVYCITVCFRNSTRFERRLIIISFFMTTDLHGVVR